jgi:hypothetical protein
MLDREFQASLSISENLNPCDVLSIFFYVQELLTLNDTYLEGKTCFDLIKTDISWPYFPENSFGVMQFIRCPVFIIFEYVMALIMDRNEYLFDSIEDFVTNLEQMSLTPEPTKLVLVKLVNFTKINFN